MKKKFFARFFSAVLCLFIILGSVSAFALPEDIILDDEGVFAAGGNTVTVGVYPFEGFTDIDENGNVTGYAVDYLNEIATHTGWSYNYVVADDWESCYSLILNGKIDIIAGTVKNDDRTQLVDFSSYGMAGTYLCLYASADNRNYAYADYTHFSSMVVAAQKNDTRVSVFQNHALKMGFSPKYVFYNTFDEAKQAVHDGKADAFLGDSMYYTSDEVSIDDFGYRELYFMINKASPWIKTDIDRAMELVFISNPGYNGDLLNKYFPKATNVFPVFTYQEKRFLENSPTLSVYYNSDLAPLSYTDKSGDASGIVFDMLDEIKNYTTLDYTAVPMNNSFMSNPQTDEYAVIPGVYNSKKILDYYNLKATKTYIQIPVVLVGRSDNSFNYNHGGKVAVLGNDTNLQHFITDKFPNLTPVFVDSVDLLFDYVEKGLADCCIEYTYVVNDYLQRQKTPTLTLISSSYDFMPLCMAVPSGTSDLLVSVLNKGINSVAEQTKSNIMLENSISSPFKTTVLTFVKLHSLSIVSIILIFLIFIIGYITYSRHTVAKIAYVDSLTGCATTAKFAQNVNRSLEKNIDPHCIVTLDICNFKFINDTIGRAEGDNLLRQLAEKLHEILKKDEYLARDYADNFVLFLRYPSQKLLARRMRNFCSSLSFVNASGNAINTPYISMGVYPIAQNDTSDIYEMLSNATLAKKNSKNTYRNTIGFYSKEMHNEILETKHLEDSFAGALKNEEFLIYLQPKYSISTRHIVGAEALVRWRHPELGLLSPGKFIPLCEHNGFIEDLDFFVYETSFKIFRDWLNAGLKPIPVSVNVSRAHLQDKDFIEKFSMLANRYEIPHHYIECELTETLFFGNISLLTDFIQRLQDNGFLVSIDDFGSGYSSLNLLKNIRADILKLDREFFADGLATERDRVVIANVINMARELDMSIICEGVETQAQVDFLSAMNCDFAQGYYFSKPLPVAEFNRLLENDKKGK